MELLPLVRDNGGTSLGMTTEGKVMTDHIPVPVFKCVCVVPYFREQYMPYFWSHTLGEKKWNVTRGSLNGDIAVRSNFQK